MERTLTLPRRVDENHGDAKLESGVLYLTLPKREEARGHRIELR